MEKIDITQQELNAATPTLSRHTIAAAGILVCNDNQRDTASETSHDQRL